MAFFSKLGDVIADGFKKTITDPTMLIPGYNVVKLANTVVRSAKEVIEDNVHYSKLPVGAALAVRRWKGIVHWGIYAGNRKVIHYVGGVVKETNMETFALDQSVWWHDMWWDNYSTAIRRARNLVGDKNFNLLFHNCEGMVMYCHHGENVSLQTVTGKQAEEIHDWDRKMVDF